MTLEMSSAKRHCGTKQDIQMGGVQLVAETAVVMQLDSTAHVGL